ncbi:hypothetical protein O6H91_17G048000 [Diphasiastrum complanatum]|uniref:Uncharacterized protein n=1 Tax=Diphasiastrum complanatum TaxID=34168 RepID=A0ACC2B6H6_DIPCM|nr:hypothetical protein O6H91_17G048000 [Diphasiastrum complanatum]
MEEKSEKKAYPTIASDYKLLEEVGQGVSAIVYRALCVPFNNEVVAIKNLDLDKCNSNLDEIRREAQTMSLINHPNVVKAYCSFVVDRNLWVVMPYMAGGSCLHIMKAAFPDGFEEPVIATILKETLKALEYLHRQGHIHRDVKAGNILIDASGAVKLGDFGVSACLFDTGDRQRSRNTFVGTPCWMAPEVLEQVHGYDFKADIWSFGITALELAHGHAPFSKYPPMKVLLMTLQNAPPGLDYERDKRFSKSFKEMIAMCLVKDPAKRPTAEKLLKHSFFKGAKSCDYVARRILDNLPPLWERVRTLKLADAARLAQKKMPYGEQEQRSQNEYKRGVSSWNFDVEDLKAQAAVIQDDAGAPALKEDELPKPTSRKDDLDSLEMLIPVPQSAPVGEQHDLQLAAIAPVAKAEMVVRSQSGVFQAHGQPKLANGTKYMSEEKEQKPFDDIEPQGKGQKDHLNLNRDIQDDRDRRRFEEKERDREEQRRPSSGPLAAERVLASYKGRDDEKDKDKDSRQLGKNGEDFLRGNPIHRERAFSGPLTSTGASVDHRPANGVSASNKPSGNKEGPDDKLKGALVQKKGRFRVTSEDVELVEENHPVPNARRTASTQALSQLSSTSQPASGSNGAVTVPIAAIMPQLQNILHQNTLQQEVIISLMNSLSPGEVSTAALPRSSHQALKGSHSSLASAEFLAEIPTDRERELLQQVVELQSRASMLGDELQIVKARNVQLERKLNAIYNKEEEERIRREEAAKDDG